MREHANVQIAVVGRKFISNFFKVFQTAYNFRGWNLVMIDRESCLWCKFAAIGSGFSSLDW